MKFLSMLKLLKYLSRPPRTVMTILGLAAIKSFHSNAKIMKTTILKSDICDEYHSGGGIKFLL